MPWFIYQGRTKFNMTKEEVIVTTVGEMSDMMACYAIEHGTAKEKSRLSVEEVLELA